MNAEALWMAKRCQRVAFRYFGLSFSYAIPYWVRMEFREIARLEYALARYWMRICEEDYQ